MRNTNSRHRAVLHNECGLFSLFGTNCLGKVPSNYTAATSTTALSDRAVRATDSILSPREGKGLTKLVWAWACPCPHAWMSSQPMKRVGSLRAFSTRGGKKSKATIVPRLYKRMHEFVAMSSGPSR